MIRSLRLHDFRCFTDLQFEPKTGTNFIIGPNAQGKTSILEAICVGARLQSPRAGTLAETIRTGCPGAAIDIRTAERHLHVRLEPPKRKISLDSVEQSGTTEYLSVLKLAWFSNDDMEIIRSGGSRRRRFLDFLCAQLDATYLKNLRNFERAVRARNALLKDNRPRREIEAFDPILIQCGNAITAVRGPACDALEPLVQQATHEIGNASESVGFHYQSGGELSAALAASRNDEVRLRQTIAGPHRDDLEITLDSMAAAKFASEGQQRTLALALKLAQTRLIMQRTGVTPVLLIDDVFGELDIRRRTNLLAGLPPDAQTLITTTHLGWLDPNPNTAVFQIHEGRLSASR